MIYRVQTPPMRTAGCSRGYRIPFTLAALFFSGLAFSQTVSEHSFVDSFALTVRYRGNLDSLTKRLTERFPEDLYRARAIFIWITDNIAYDYKFYNRHTYKGKEVKTYTCRDDQDCEARRIAWETKYLDRVLRRKRAVCEGYAMLFKKMCDLAGLRSEVIPGYVRSKYYQVGTFGTMDHAWNAVWIDSAYYLLDPTWAAGGCVSDEDGKLLNFEQNFDNYYWMTPPADFVRDHYPRDTVWTLIPYYTKDRFAANPYYDPGKLPVMQLITPKTGIIHAKKGDTIRFKIEYNPGVDTLQINSNIFRNPDIWVSEKIRRSRRMRILLDTLAFKRQRYVSFRREGDCYEFEYVVTDNSLYFLDILFDRHRVMRFNVHVDAAAAN